MILKNMLLAADKLEESRGMLEFCLEVAERNVFDAKIRR
jgi:hypothetical protein